MKKYLQGLCFLAGWLCAGVFAQNWTAYTPPERDFQVLFPETPTYLTKADGSVEYMAGEEINYIVYRHKTRLAPNADVAQVIRQRLVNVYGDDRPLAQIHSDDRMRFFPDQYVFRIGGSGGIYTIHKVFASGDRFYELVVRSRGGGRATASMTASDFFATFKPTGFASTLTASPLNLTLDQLCKDRTDSFSRAFCEFRACFDSTFEKLPACVRLLGR